jgi:hypothetical protein
VFLPFIGIQLQYQIATAMKAAGKAWPYTCPLRLQALKELVQSQCEGKPLPVGLFLINSKICLGKREETSGEKTS